MWDLRATSFTGNTVRWCVAAINLYTASAFFVKLSILLLYLRLFKVQPMTRYIIFGGMLTCGLFYSASIISNCAVCIPGLTQQERTRTWTKHIAQCYASTAHLALVQSVFAAISDIYLMVIPVRSVINLRLPTGKKIGACCIFLCGAM